MCCLGVAIVALANRKEKKPEVVTVLQREGSRDSEGKKEHLKRGEGSGSGNGSSVGVVTGEAKGHGETKNLERLHHRKGNLSRKDTVETGYFLPYKYTRLFLLLFLKRFFI